MATMQRQRPVVIKEFADALEPSKLWRIDWLGNVGLKDHHLAQHQIDVYFSPVNRGFNGLCTDPEAADSTQQVRVPVGVGCLPMLHMGAIFKGGSEVPQLPQRSRRLRFFVDADHQTPFKLAAKIDRLLQGENRLKVVTPDEFSVGTRAWPHAAESQVIGVRDQRETDPYFLTIPSIEIVRFFFCTTSVLARNLFANAWEALLWPDGCEERGLPHELTVGMRSVAGVRYRDARTLGLKLASPVARVCIDMAHQSAQSPRNAPRKPIPCGIPTTGPMEIVAEVISVDTGTALGWRYFVTRLISCEWQVPFDICYANPMIHPGKGVNCDSEDLIPVDIPKADDPGPPGPTGGPRLSNRDELEGEPEVTDEHGRPCMLDGEINIYSPENRFPKLNEVPTPLSRKEYQKCRHDPEQKKARSKPVDAHSASTAEPGGSSKPVAPAVVDTNPPRARPAFDPDSLISLLRSAALRLNEYGYLVQTLSPLALADSQDVSSAKRSWTKIRIGVDEETMTPIFRSRYLIGLLVTANGRQCILADIERRGEQPYSLFGFLVPTDRTADEFYQTIGRAVAIRRGWPSFSLDAQVSQFDDQTKVTSARIFHQATDNSEKLAGRIRSSILSALLPLAVSNRN